MGQVKPYLVAGTGGRVIKSMFGNDLWQRNRCKLQCNTSEELPWWEEEESAEWGEGSSWDLIALTRATMAMAMLISDKKRRMQHDDNMFDDADSNMCCSCSCRQQVASVAPADTLPRDWAAFLAVRWNTPRIMICFAGYSNSCRHCRLLSAATLCAFNREIFL